MTFRDVSGSPETLSRSCSLGAPCWFQAVSHNVYNMQSMARLVSHNPSIELHYPLHCKTRTHVCLFQPSCYFSGGLRKNGSLKSVKSNGRWGSFAILRRSGASCNVGRILKCWNFNLGCHLLVSSWYRLAINGKNCHVSRLWNITQPIHWASHFQEADVICVHSINPHKLRLPLSAKLLLTSAEDLKDLRSSKSGKAMEGGGFATYWRSWSCVQKL